MADALRPVKARLEGMAEGVKLELCVDAFMGVEARVCPCGKRWLSRLAMGERDATGRGFSRVAFGCKPCGEMWTPADLETAVQTGRDLMQPYDLMQSGSASNPKSCWTAKNDFMQSRPTDRGGW